MGWGWDLPLSLPHLLIGQPSPSQLSPDPPQLNFKPLTTSKPYPSAASKHLQGTYTKSLPSASKPRIPSEGLLPKLTPGHTKTRAWPGSLHLSIPGPALGPTSESTSSPRTSQIPYFLWGLGSPRVCLVHWWLLKTAVQWPK